MERVESHEAGFPPFPLSLEIPSGFPHSHGLDDWRYMSSRAPSYSCASAHMTYWVGVAGGNGPLRFSLACLAFLFSLGVLDWITLALGGAAGSRLARRMGLLVDGSTLLRQLRRRSRATATARAPRVLGIDDWAWRKGHRYGTILCDLESRRVVDLLPAGRARP
jgi:hypothetical protein